MAGVRSINWARWLAGRSLRVARGLATRGEFRRGDVVIVHSTQVPTTSVGIHVNGCRANWLLALVALNMLGDKCREALLHDVSLALPSGGRGRIILPLHQMTAKPLFICMHWGQFARAMMASLPALTLEALEPVVPTEAALSFLEAAMSNVNLQDLSHINASDPPTAQVTAASRPIQSPPPSGGGGPQ